MFKCYYIRKRLKLVHGSFMKIVVLRHGDAIYSNSDRVLSSTGMKEASSTGEKLSKYVKFTKCFCSPKTRAKQTAQIVLTQNNCDCKIEILSDLTPSGDPSQVISYIEATCSKDDTVLLVSHLPLVWTLSYDFNKNLLMPPQFDTACALIMEHDGLRAKYQCFLAPNKDDYLF